MRCHLRSCTMRNVAGFPLVAIAILVLGRANAEDVPPATDAQAILNRVVKAVADNRAQLKDVRAEILVVTENHQVDKPTKKVFHQKGGTATAYASPRTTSRETIAISGDQFRFDRTGRSDFDEVNPEATWLIKPGEWQLYQPGPKWLKIWSRPEQLPGVFPIDPRDYGCHEMAMGLLKWLRSLDVRSAELVPQSDGTTLARLHLSKHDNQFLLECSSGDGFLPSLVVLSYKERVFATDEIHYQPVLKGRAWFPKSMILRSFKETPRDPRSNDCQAATKWFVTKLDVQSGDKPRPIAPLQVPLGTQIQDMRRSHGRPNPAPLNRG